MASARPPTLTLTASAPCAAPCRMSQCVPAGSMWEAAGAVQGNARMAGVQATCWGGAGRASASASSSKYTWAMLPKLSHSSSLGCVPGRACRLKKPVSARVSACPHPVFSRTPTTCSSAPATGSACTCLRKHSLSLTAPSLTTTSCTCRPVRGRSTRSRCGRTGPIMVPPPARMSRTWRLSRSAGVVSTACASVLKVMSCTLGQCRLAASWPRRVKRLVK
mmetsp:Transcript_36180/g.90792  ORF Transcript_36180/g.90792 Transcript_36180/m.90792 type:complete len:220 (-) Transcript_36180:454-1113(-)